MVGAGVGRGVGRAVGCGVLLGVAVGLGDELKAGEDAEGEADAVSFGDSDALGGALSDGAASDGETDPDVAGDPAAVDDGLAAGSSLGATANRVVRTWAELQNGWSEPQSLTSPFEATRTTYVVCPSGRAGKGATPMVSPPGPVGHMLSPVVAAELAVILPLSVTTNALSASGVADSSTVPVWSATSKK